MIKDHEIAKYILKQPKQILIENKNKKSAFYINKTNLHRNENWLNVEKNVKVSLPNNVHVRIKQCFKTWQGTHH